MRSDDGPDDMPESAWISEARRLAASAVMLLEHPRMRAGEGDSGLYETAIAQAKLILHLVDESERCATADEFDVVYYLICCQADSLALTYSLLRIP
jgi:hypothetical protein